MDTLIKKVGGSLIILFVLFGLVLGVFSPVYSNSQFAGREEELSEQCSSRQGYQKDPKMCEAFKKYLQEQKAESDKNLSEIKGQIGSITGDIQKDTKIIQSISERIEKLTRDIQASEKLVRKKQSQIDSLNRQIVVREKDIEAKKEQAREYMLHMQSTSRVNSYFDFILGASDFSEVSRRVEGINLINQKNQENIIALNEEKAKLEEDKLDLVFEQKNLEEAVEVQKQAANEQKTLREDSEVRLRKLRQQHASLIAAKEEEEAQRKLATQRINSITAPPPSTGSLALPISSGFRVSASVWSYPGDTTPSGKHIGLDLAAPLGTTIVAPASGLVIATNKGCATVGGFPSHNCDSNYGNYLLMIVNNNGTIYGILYGHMRNGGVLVNTGQTVTKGQKVGEVGSSGSSTGYHLHAEIYYLGNDSVEAAYDRWYNGPRNNNFGAGPKSVEYNNRCDVKGMVAPCRLHPGTTWGLKLGESR